MAKDKPIFYKIMQRAISFGFFLLLVISINIIAQVTGNRFSGNLSLFLNDNILLMLFFSTVFAIGECFVMLRRPLSLAAPIIYAVGALFLVRFLSNMLLYAASEFGLPLLVAPARYLLSIADPFVFWGGMAIGFAMLFLREGGLKKVPKKK